MKHNHNHDNLPGTQLVPVRFEFTHPTAKTVCVAGTFNHWQPEAKTLHSSGAGNWWKETSLAPGTCEYCLVVSDLSDDGIFRQLQPVSGRSILQRLRREPAGLQPKNG
jgi:1,4-alpha-glucan branching enzyme